ncbi:MAG TPA: Asp-tRNA(Asn)/Glu-tRNA(Gln) amidotransferase subunit GatB [Thermomicrobiales bacterium]|nr:Asp-tRNA(Asn)/Glu-tRNA(Gln) amidotransferase subunit GatB [Thermomicrobiales bacterium]
MEFETIIGLEVHAQVLTSSKMYCGCSSEYFSAPPNTHVCPVCLGLPGVLPVINRVALEKTIATGIALGSEIPPYNKFDRKNYIYPDLMKGYQISQYDLPMAVGGQLEFDVDGERKRVGITRVHLEEDTARLVHRVDSSGDRSLVDVNRGGVPLMEIVSDPDLRSPQEAREYLIALRRILRYIGASAGNMEEGSFRCDANVSQRSTDGTIVGPKVEIKNMNSFRAVERAVSYEVERQRAALERGETLIQETRGWVEDQGITVGQRTKEQAHDYRYFPEPDLPPVELDAAVVAEIRSGMAELPEARRARLMSAFGLGPQDSTMITEEPAIADYYEQAVASASGHHKDIANWLVGDVFALARAQGGFDRLNLPPDQLAEVVVMVRSGEINAQAGKDVLAEANQSGTSPRTLVEQRGLRQETDEDKVRAVVNEVLGANPSAVADYHAGKQAAIGFLIGQVMKSMRGTGNPTIVRHMMTQVLNESAQ